MKIRNTLVAGAAASLLLIGGGAVAAQADNSALAPGNAIKAVHSTSAKQLSVYDNKSDGLGGRALYELSNGSTGNLDNDRGYGTTTYKSITGSGTITFKACTKSGPTTKDCSGQVSSKI